MNSVIECKRMLARMCVALESYGADVQKYIRDNMPSITPRAAWYNLQREYLERKPANLREGKADEELMAKSRQKQEKTVQMLMEAVRNGQDAYAVLKACGFTNPYCALKNAKAWCKMNKPDWYPAISGLSVPKEDYQETPKTADSAACKDLPKDDSSKVPETAEMGSQPAGAVRKKTKMDVIEVKTDLGTFRWEDGKIAFRRVDDGTDYKNVLKMSTFQWLELKNQIDDIVETLAMEE